MSAWRWDRTREPIMKFPLKEELTVAKLQPSSMNMCIGGTKQGRV